MLLYAHGWVYDRFCIPVPLTQLDTDLFTRPLGGGPGKVK